MKCPSCNNYLYVNIGTDYFAYHHCHNCNVDIFNKYYTDHYVDRYKNIEYMLKTYIHSTKTVVSIRQLNYSNPKPWHILTTFDEPLNVDNRGNFIRRAKRLVVFS